MKRNIYNHVASNHPTLNHFDLSYTNTTSMDFGYIYPVQCDEVYPGDVFKMSAYVHCEVMPMVAPVMSDIQMFAHTFFVPYRLIYGVDNEDGKSIWEKFISGGEDGDYETPLPGWSPSFSKTGFSSKTIWDCVGNPMNFDSVTNTWTPVVPDSTYITVSVAPRLAYNFIWNEYYRDENLQDEVADTNEDLLVASFKKDYFTSALEAQQRGVAPALPVDITGSADVYFKAKSASAIAISGFPYLGLAPEGSNGQPMFPNDGTSTSLLLYAGTTDTSAGAATAVKGSVDISNVSATTFTVSDMRLAFAIQRMLELNMTGGYRYTEWLNAHFGVHPTDSRLDRPEYIGGSLISIGVSPLTQNSETASTPQGTKVGIGSVDTVQKIGNYRCLEHGLIMTLVSIRPKPIYQQGINRQWLRQTRFDYYAPELAYLSEQGIYNCELYTDGLSTTDDSDIFGYQAHWNEMRCKNNLVSGAVREQFDYWTLSRKFNSRPALNEDFIKIDSDDFNKIFAVQDEDPFIVSWSNIIDSYRPIPAMGTPGLVDHVYGGR